MSKPNPKPMMERMELVNGLNRELNRKVYAYAQLVKDNPERWNIDSALTLEKKCTPESIHRVITLLREQLLLLEKEV